MKKLSFVFYLILIQTGLMGQTVTLEKEVVMLALGDSYTIGESVALQHRWPHQFMDTLRSLGFSGGDPDYIARTGWTTRNLLNGMQSALRSDREYNLVSVLIGVNNQYQGIPLEEYEPELREILDQALGIVSNDTSRLIMLSIPDYAYTPFGRGNASISQDIDEYNEIKAGVAADYNIRLFDVTSISRQGLQSPALVAADGLHPSGEQYALWVDRLVSGLDLSASPLSGEKVIADQGFSFYPNPAHSVLHLKNTAGVKQVRIVNSSGRILLEQQVRDLRQSLDISRLDPGIYTLQLLGSTGTREAHRFVILRS